MPHLIYNGKKLRGDGGNLYMGEPLITIPIPNSGGNGTTDWVDTNTDGLADDWTKSASQSTAIVTGNGFTGNAQQISGAAGEYIYSDPVSVVLNNDYTLSFKYRASVAGNLYSVYEFGGGLITDIFVNTAWDATPAASFTSSPFTVTSSQIVIRINDGNSYGTIQSDELVLTQV